MYGSSRPTRPHRLPQYPGQDHMANAQQTHPYPPLRHEAPCPTHRHHPYPELHRTTSQPQLSLHPLHRPSHNHLAPPSALPQQRYHQPQPHVSQPPRPEAPISGGSVFGQINLLADVATREADGQRHRPNGIPQPQLPTPATRPTGPASDSSAVRGWAPDKPAGQVRTETRRLPPLIPGSGSASSSGGASPTAAARHPLSDLTLDKEYAPYVPGKLQADVRRMLHAPTSSANATPPPPGPPGPLPQWPASQGQAHGKVVTDNGRTWVTLERPRAPAAPVAPVAPATSAPVTPAPASAAPATSSTNVSPYPQPRVSPKPPLPAYSLPTPPVSSRRQRESESASVEVKSETQDVSVQASGDTSESEDSDAGDSDSADGYVPSSPRTALKVGWTSRTLRSSTRAHSSSLSSSASAPLPSHSASSPSSPLRRRAGSHPEAQASRRGSTSSTQPKHKGTKRKAVRRDGERRREQNAVAQKKFRYKKKMIEQQMASELEESRAQMAVLEEELAKVRHDSLAQIAKVKAESEAEIARLKAENDALRA